MIEHEWYLSSEPMTQGECTAAVPGAVLIPGTPNKCINAFLRNAVEVMFDGVGNDNGLCEPEEVCRNTPNIGAYQGSSASTFVY